MTIRINHKAFSKVAVLLFALVFITNWAAAQDIIYKRDGSKVEAKIVEVGPQKIKYKKSDNPDGPDYVIMTHEVMLITYANGQHDTFALTEVPTFKKSKKIEEFGNYLVNFNIFSMLMARVTMGAEYITNDGYVGFHAIGGFGLGPTANVRQLKYKVGVEVKAYPGAQKRASYFLGPGMEFGSRSQWQWFGFDEPNEIFENYTAGYLVNGFLFNFHKHLNFSVAVGLGIQSAPRQFPEPYGKLEGNLIVRF